MIPYDEQIMIPRAELVQIVQVQVFGSSSARLHSNCSRS